MFKFGKKLTISNNVNMSARDVEKLIIYYCVIWTMKLNKMKSGQNIISVSKSDNKG